MRAGVPVDSIAHRLVIHPKADPLAGPRHEAVAGWRLREQVALVQQRLSVVLDHDLLGQLSSDGDLRRHAQRHVACLQGLKKRR